jgi:hypothetical protein
MHALFVTAHIEPTGRSLSLDVGDEAARQPEELQAFRFVPTGSVQTLTTFQED